jgi:hypothetical protein
MPIVSTKPAMPGSVMTAPTYAIRPSRITRLKTSATTAFTPDSLVVDEHEQHDEQQADERREHARANRVGAERRTDRALSR